MPTAEGHARTQRAGRYLAQLCTHLDQLQHQPHPHSAPHPAGEPMPQIRQVQWSDTHGTVSFGHSQLTLQATPDQLIMRVQAADEQNLHQTQQLLTHRIQQIGRRDHLTVTWQPTTPDNDNNPAPAKNTDPVQHAAPAHRRRTTIILAAAATLAIGLHIAAATALTTRWTSWAAATVLVIIAIKLAALALGGRALHHRIRHRPPHHSHRP